jgi:hypothetical protein
MISSEFLTKILHAIPIAYYILLDLITPLTSDDE